MHPGLSLQTAATPLHFPVVCAVPKLVAFNEGDKHRTAKAALARALRDRGLTVGIEAAAGSVRRADLLVRSPAGRAIAIEIQNSAISLADVQQRTADHAAAGIATLWLPILDLPAQALRPVRGACSLYYVRTALPAWVEWLEARAGALWFWCRDALWRGWLAPAWVRAPRSPATDPGECGWRPSTRLRMLSLEGPVAPPRTRLLVRPASARADHRFGLMAGPCATLVCAGEATPPACPTVVEWVSAIDGVRPVVRVAGAGSATRH